MDNDEYVKMTLDEYGGGLVTLYEELKDKRPVMLINIEEKRIYAYPYKDFLTLLPPRSQDLLKSEYKKANEEGNMVVFIKDNERQKLVSFIY